jgi:hypothetical protein
MAGSVDQSCVGGMDDREHIGAGVKIPICTDEQSPQADQ